MPARLAATPVAGELAAVEAAGEEVVAGEGADVVYVDAAELVAFMFAALPFLNKRMTT